MGGLFLPSIQAADTFYVDATYGNNSNSGYTWPAAKKTIFAAMELANGYDTICVAQGVYNEKVTFPEAHANQLLGGYPPGGGTRDPKKHVTIIDGMGTGANGAVVVIPGDPDADGYEGIVIDGFTISNGTDCTNTAGGIFSNSMNVAINNCIVENNSSDGMAGGIGVYGGIYGEITGPFIEKTIVRNNTTTGNYGAGGLYFGGNREFAYYPGASLKNVLVTGNRSICNGAVGVGAMNIQFPAMVSMINCTIADNIVDGSAATKVPGILVGGLSASDRGWADIKNTIIWHQSGDDIYIPSLTGEVYLSYCDVEDSSDSGTGVIHADPDFFGGSDYHLTSFFSPCCDSATANGAPSRDLDGLKRPKGYGCDMGVYEFLYGDFDGDKAVDVDDLDRLILVWLADDPNCDMAPHGGDGVIDLADFSLLAGNWQISIDD